MASSARALAVTIALMFGTFAPEALAQSPEERESARGLMEQGDKLEAEGDAKGALEAFAAADEIMKVPTTGLARGRVLLVLGRLVEASDVLLRVSRSPAAPGEDPVLTAARAEATRLATEIAPRIPSLVVNVQGPPDGVVPEITIDGRKVSGRLAGLPIKIDPGERAVVVSAPGFVEARRTVKVKEAGRAELAVTLERDPTAPATPETTGEPGAPPAVRGHGDASEPNDGAAAESGGIPTWSWVVGGIGIAALAGSGAALGVQLSAAGALDEACGEDRQSCPRSYDFGPDRSREQVANGFFIGLGVAGLVGVGAGVIGIATAPATSGRKAARVRPWFGPEGAGVGLAVPLEAM